MGRRPGWLVGQVICPDCDFFGFVCRKSVCVGYNLERSGLCCLQTKCTYVPCVPLLLNQRVDDPGSELTPLLFHPSWVVMNSS